MFAISLSILRGFKRKKISQRNIELNAPNFRTFTVHVFMPLTLKRIVCLLAWRGGGRGCILLLTCPFVCLFVILSCA